MTTRSSRALSCVLSPALALLLGAAPAAAWAQSYRFPASDAHYGYFYPTAYVDEGGSDWNCGSIYYGGHQGSDFGIGSWSGMDEGRAVVAAADGVVIATNDGEFDRCETADCGEANYVILEHADGRRTWYWHLKQWTVAVSAGQVVTCGTHLGYAGSSGNSTGPHLHFEVREASGGMGDADTYFLDTAARHLDDLLKSTQPPADARLEFGPRQPHGWEPRTWAELLKEMQAAVDARAPKSAAANHDYLKARFGHSAGTCPVCKGGR